MRMECPDCCRIEGRSTSRGIAFPSLDDKHGFAGGGPDQCGGCAIKEGDWVEIFGANLPVDDVARQAETIAYEVYTGIGSRVVRLL